MASFDEVLESALKTDERFLDENGDLLREAVVNAAYNIDEKLVRILLDKKQPKVKEAFFSEIEKHWVFNINKFVSYIQDKNFLNDSYTQYKNKIGLTVDGKFLRERGEVSLVWPFKDCVLEGGMTKEDQDRKEIFFNETLAQDEIDKLFEQKVLTNGARYTKEGKKKASPLKRDSEGRLKDNLIIKGNNLLALHALKNQFSEAVKLIFIDPPFNTGDDEFRYNDKFSHSTWLTFTKNRLEASYKLLASDGVIAVYIGHEESDYIKLLLDEVFGRDNYLNHITTSTNDPSGFKATSTKIFSTANHTYLYAKDAKRVSINKVYVEKKYDENYKYIITNPKDDYKKWKFVPIIDLVAKEKGYSSVREYKKNNSPEAVVADLAKFADLHKEFVFRTAAIGGGAKLKRQATINKSQTNKGIVFQHPNEDIKGFYILNGEGIVFWGGLYKEIDGKFVPAQALTDVWTDIKWTGIASEGGVTLKNGKKPEKLIKRILELVTTKDDLVLDYHLGSGTTCAVAHKMQRRYIGIEQLEYGKNSTEYRITNVVNGDESGISKLVNWKGGGDFVYFELKKFNQDFIEQIESAGDTKKLLKIWEEMKQKAFFKHNFEMKKFEESLASFKALPVAKQKALLLEILDKNQLYVNVGDIDDKRFKISAEDKQLTKEFYGE